MIQDEFPELLNQQFSNLTQLKSQVGSLQKTIATQNALRGLFTTIAPHIEALPGYRKPFSLNCSVFFDAEIDQVVCDAQFEDVQETSASCRALQELPHSYLTKLHKSSTLQMRVVVGLDPLQHPQVMYWLYYKLPPTDTTTKSALKTQTSLLSNSSTASESWLNSFSLSATPSQSKLSLTLRKSASDSKTASLSSSPSVSMASTNTLSRSSSNTLSETPSLFGCQTTTPPVAGVLAAWNQTGGTYADATSQASRYSVSNGVVTDSLTNMQWEQTAGTGTMAWSAATSYCAGRSTGGLSGWRAPNIVELQTLVDYTIAYNTPPQINPAAFPGAPASNLWASTPDAGNAGNSWYLRLSNFGYSTYTTATTAYPLRSVRSCYPAPPSSRYTVSSGEVTDSVTGLIWQQTSTGSTMIQANAITHCTGLGLNGHTWRLPTARELSTLVDYSVPYGSLMMDATVFAGEPVGGYWSSTPLTGYPTRAWGVAFYYGNVFVDGVANARYARCLR